MRLDKFLVATGCCSRTEAKKIVRAGGVSINGRVPKSSDEKVDPERDEVIFCGKKVIYREFTYIMLNKPEGYVSATEDNREKTVLDLLPDEVNKSGLFPCGRLDKNTLGLMLITDDGDLAHQLLSPKNHVSKVYGFRCREPLSDNDAERLCAGVDIGEDYITKPAKISLDDGHLSGKITIDEGKYHQIKRMFEAVDNKITYLERLEFGALKLDNSLERGQWRYLTDGEIASLGKK